MPRFDSLTPIHKAIRAMVYETGGDMQRADFADEKVAAEVTADLGATLELMLDHHASEEEYVFPVLQPFEAELVADMLGQHERVVGLLDMTNEARAGVTASEGDLRAVAGADLNRRFNELVAVFFDHLAEEEARLLPAMWRRLDDGQLVAIQGRIIAAAEPDTMFRWLRWMFRGLNRAELTAMLAGAKQGMPAPALDAVRALGAATLEPLEWEAVRTGAGL